MSELKITENVSIPVHPSQVKITENRKYRSSLVHGKLAGLFPPPAFFFPPSFNPSLSPPPFPFPLSRPYAISSHLLLCFPAPLLLYFCLCLSVSLSLYSSPPLACSSPFLTHIHTQNPDARVKTNTHTDGTKIEYMLGDPKTELSKEYLRVQTDHGDTFDQFVGHQLSCDHLHTHTHFTH